MTAAALLESVDRWLYSLVLRYARVVPPRHRADFVEEFLADVRAEVFLRADSYDPSRGSLTTWACWRARKAFSNRQRVLTRERVRREKLRARPAAPRAAPSAALAAVDAGEAFEALVAPALVAERVALTLRFRDGLTLDQIGERMGGLTRERARQILAAGLDRIRDARTT
jgi:RNA polymerase sigma factor (sigma-70 family)